MHTYESFNLKPFKDMPIFERHAFSGFDQEVRDLIATIDQMRNQCIELIGHFRRTCQNSEEGYKTAKALDKEINAGEIEADNKIFEIIAKYTPAGDEMRYVLSMFKVAYIYERSADKIKNSVKRLCRVSQPVPPLLIQSFEQMTDVLVEMLELAPQTLGAYKDEDMNKLAEMKRTVSGYQKQAILTLQKMPAEVIASEVGSDLIFVIKNIERVSDLMLDLAKVGYFIATGKKFERVS